LERRDGFVKTIAPIIEEVVPGIERVLVLPFWML